MSRIENCDEVVGSGNTIITAGAYKDADDNTRYKFGIRVNLPDFTPELTQKIMDVGKARVMSVHAAGTFNKANEYGTLEDAQAFAEQFSTVEGWEKAFEKARREGGAPKQDSAVTRAIQELANLLKIKHGDNSLAAAKVPVPRLNDPPMTEKGKINFNAWAKILREEEYPWYAQCLTAAQKYIAARQKAVAGFE